jgi:hypothetical protein
MKLDGVKVRGYEAEWFADAFARYLPSPVETRSTRYLGTSERELERASTGVPGESPFPEERADSGTGSRRTTIPLLSGDLGGHLHEGDGEFTCLDCGRDFPTANSVVLHYSLGQCQVGGSAA